MAIKTKKDFSSYLRSSIYAYVALICSIIISYKFDHKYYLSFILIMIFACVISSIFASIKFRTFDQLSILIVSAFIACLSLFYFEIELFYKLGVRLMIIACLWNHFSIANIRSEQAK